MLYLHLSLSTGQTTNVNLKTTARLLFPNKTNMNKHFFFGHPTAWAVLFCLLAHTSCINQIESEVTEGSIPITFSAKVKKTGTKVTGSLFDKGDQIALYATLSGNSLGSSRYLDNLLLTSGDDNQLIPQREVFYPEDNSATLDFVCYYPYTAEGLPKGSSKLSFAVHTDQSQAGNLSLSDLLVARKSKVKSSTSAVSLEFGHKLAKLKITLTPGEGEDLDEMLEADPKIVAAGFCTQTEYDLETDAFGEPELVADITPGGNWKKDGGKLTGKEFIVIPQSTGDGQLLQMEWNGRIYSCLIPELESVESNTQYELDINATQSSSTQLTGIVATIAEWEEGTRQETDNTSPNASLHLSVLTFNESNVYHVHANGKVIAEICKEYLKNEQLDAQALVAYPISEGETADLSRGTVLQLSDDAGNTCGGSLAWNKGDNSFIYTPGNLPAIGQVYFDATGNVLTEKPEQPLDINVIAYTIRDMRSGLQAYPIVKIGTQYWMRSNLKATAYRDGTPIDQQTQLGKGPSYFKPTNYDLCFYNGEALLNKEMAPSGWQLPSKTDWEKLLQYVGGKAAPLKTGKWEVLIQNEEKDKQPAAAENTCMFGLYATGIWVKGQHSNPYKMTGLWTWDAETQSIPEQTLFFMGEEDKAVWDNTKSGEGDFYKALAVRCLRQE